jgi:hypothetical protein
LGTIIMEVLVGTFDIVNDTMPIALFEIIEEQL